VGGGSGDGSSVGLHQRGVEGGRRVAGVGVGARLEAGGERVTSRQAGCSEWEQLMCWLSDLQIVHPSVPRAALVCIVYD
jgi:hypothetical protein